MSYLQIGANMRKITKFILPVIVVLLLYISSCIDGGKKSYSKWEIVNNSGMSILITVYSNGEYQNSININSSADFWETEYYISSGMSNEFPGITDAIGGDSINIVFDENRKSVFIFPHDPLDSFNVLNPNLYSIIHDDDQHTIYRYTFTEADYENAEPIGE